jgi:hypothetical protein
MLEWSTECSREACPRVNKEKCCSYVRRCQWFGG